MSAAILGIAEERCQISPQKHAGAQAMPARPHPENEQPQTAEKFNGLLFAKGAQGFSPMLQLWVSLRRIPQYKGLSAFCLSAHMLAEGLGLEVFVPNVRWS
jgi:hypothetical protein